VDSERIARFQAALREAGMSRVPRGFSVAPLHQEIPSDVLAGIDRFIDVFDHVTARPAWQEAVTASAPLPARERRPEVCFFSAWDFHLPPGAPERWQLIEFNDNGSGFVFAALINRAYYEAVGAAALRGVEPPPTFSDFTADVAARVDREARAFFGQRPEGGLLVVDDAESLAAGRFGDELVLLRELLRRDGWPAEIAAIGDLRWDGERLRHGNTAICFVVNRSTDFLWEGGAASALRAAWASGRVYVAPNPFTYATRSDKALLALLSRPERDAELGIEPGERRILDAHVPETLLLGEESLEEIARRKGELVLKPVHGFSGRGLLPSAQVGRSRLRRLLRDGEGYVAQRRIPKSTLDVPGEAPLYCDLRVWAYRGRRCGLSGRASRRPGRIDLASPGGWLPTYAQRGTARLAPGAAGGSAAGDS
jgi:hypothetical protein